MIWTVFLIMAAGTVAFLVIGRGAADRSEDAEVAEYLAQIDAVKADTSLDDATRSASVVSLERQLLARREGVGGTMTGRWAIGVGVIVLGAGGVIYSQVGRPDLVALDAPDRRVVSAPVPEAELTDLVAELERRLRGDRQNDPAGWQILARSRMTLQRYDAALDAYDQAVALSEGAAQEGLRAERRAAAAAILRAKAPQIESAPRGPSQADMRDAQSLSTEDRDAFIRAMVDGLSDRLEESPRDAAGWIRLLRARRTLGDMDALDVDLSRMRSAFADDPELVRAILVASDLSE